MRAAYLDCPSGASGNMLLAAFLDAGAPLAAVEAATGALGLGDAAALHVERTSRAGVAALHVDVEVREPRPWRGVLEIDQLIEASALDEGVRERARLAFRLLASAEAAAHGVKESEVVLHEAGAVDALVDVVGTFAAAESLGIEAFYASALPFCEGTTVAAHGVIPLPAPATVRILTAAGAPTYRRDGDAELVTPTGAAILGACATFTRPELDVEMRGVGAGTVELPWANVLTVEIGELVETTTSPEAVTVIETNIDDMAPNLLADVPRAMLDAGALEAFLTPVVMKKGRSGHVLTVICKPADADALARRLLRETTTLGVRLREERRVVAGRRVESMTGSLGEMRVKLKLLDGRVVDAVPESDDVLRLAASASLPLTEAQRTLALEARRHFVHDAHHGEQS